MRGDYPWMPSKDVEGTAVLTKQLRRKCEELQRNIERLQRDTEQLLAEVERLEAK